MRRLSPSRSSFGPSRPSVGPARQLPAVGGRPARRDHVAGHLELLKSREKQNVGHVGLQVRHSDRGVLCWESETKPLLIVG